MIVLAVLVVFVGALLCCGLYLRLARRWQLYDIPNDRSAHHEPTPRGGGVGIFLGLLAGVLMLASFGADWPSAYGWMLLLAGLLVIAGVLDDRYNLPVLARLVLYGLACIAMVLVFYWPAPPWLLGLTALYALWLLNLFNFMDGIDGIAASEAIFVTGAAGLISLWQGAEWHYPLFCLLLAVACLGFLHWNWSPARLFMGDAGSISIGFLLAALSLLGQITGALPLVCWLILLAVFLADATITLVWRGLVGERVTEAHSRHLYQRLARHWGSHRRVVLAMLAFNVFWLLPLALLSVYWPRWGWAALLGAVVPLLVASLKAGKLP